MVDSGSRDRSCEIARGAGATLLGYPAGGVRTRSHPKPRRGQDLRRADRVPDPGRHAGPRRRLAARRELRARRARRPPSVAPAAGRRGNPLTARLLLDFFGGFSPGGEPVVHRDPAYLSNSNSCIARERPGRRSRSRPAVLGGPEQGRPARRRLGQGLQPARGGAPFHDYGLIEGFRRYFDEYRGLRDNVGRHSGAGPGAAGDLVRQAAGVVGGAVEPIAPTSPSTSPRGCGGRAGPPRARSTTQGESSSAASAGAPTACRSRCGRCSRSSDRATASRAVRAGRRGATRTPCASSPTGSCRSLTSPFDDSREALELAWVVPPFGVGSGSPGTIFGSAPSSAAGGTAAALGARPRRGRAAFERLAAPADRPRLRAARGADPSSGSSAGAAATWPWPPAGGPSFRCSEAAAHPRAPGLPRAGSRARVLRRLREGAPGPTHVQARAGRIAASPWLAELLRRALRRAGHGLRAGRRPERVPRPPGGPETDGGLLRARLHAPTWRGAGPARAQALPPAAARPSDRPVPGTHNLVRAPFASEQLGVETSERLSRLYAEATVGSACH